MRRLWSTRTALPNNLGAKLLCGWLVTTGMVALLNFGSDLLDVILNVVAVAAGVLLFFDR